MNDNLIAEAVFEYLENGSKLPEEASKNPQMRFKFQTVIARQTYKKSCVAVNVAENAKTTSESNEIRLNALTMWFKWLTGVTAVGGIVLGGLTLLGVI